MSSNDETLLAITAVLFPYLVFLLINREKARINYLRLPAGHKAWLLEFEGIQMKDRYDG